MRPSNHLIVTNRCNCRQSNLSRNCGHHHSPDSRLSSPRRSLDVEKPPSCTIATCEVATSVTPSKVKVKRTRLPVPVHQGGEHPRWCVKFVQVRRPERVTSGEAAQRLDTLAKQRHSQHAQSCALSALDNDEQVACYQSTRGG